MKKKYIRSLFGVVLAMSLVFSYPATKVFATEVFGSWKTETVNGITYKFCASVYRNDGKNIGAYLNVKCDPIAPAGYLGARALLYDNSGNVVKNSGWQYSDSTVLSWYLPSGTTQTKGIYYSIGQIRCRRETIGYMTYDTTTTPKLQLYVLTNNRYKVNDSGQTYGSNYGARTMEESPDLIRVIGVNGFEGYVYNEQFNIGENINSPSEALEYESSRASSYSIPVYKADGITEIDSFVIGEPDAMN